MAKELPYFRFTVQDWQNGKISLESYELKGLFIDVCGYYWINDCSITLAMLRKKFSNAISMLSELIDLGIIKHENRHDKVEIEFLNFQYDLLSEKRKRRQDAGSKGGNAKAMLKQKGSYKDKDKDNNKDKDKESITLEIPKSGLVDSFFESLENSTDLEMIAAANKIPLKTAQEALGRFKKHSEVSYPTYQKFVYHFKNWLAKNINKPETDPEWAGMSKEARLLRTITNLNNRDNYEFNNTGTTGV